MEAFKSDLPLVTVIVPVFNGDRYLRESLDSILAQTYPCVEVLVMDDASTDDTPDILARYGDRLKYHRQSQNRGIYSNMNDGIALAQGEYIAIYHADDIYEPTIVEREVAFLQTYPEVGAVFCKDVFIDPDGTEVGRLTLPVEVQGGQPLPYRVVLNSLMRYKNRFICCPSCMMPSAVYRQIGPYRQELFRNTSDLDMWLQVAKQYPIGILEEYLFRYRRGHGNSSQRYHHLRTEAERFFLIMDLYLQDGGQAIAEPAALAAYEAHRCEDWLMIAVNHYILGQRRQVQTVLAQIQLSHLLGSPQIQRGRLLILFLLLHLLVQVPPITLFASLFYQRWHAKRGLVNPLTNRPLLSFIPQTVDHLF